MGIRGSKAHCGGNGGASSSSSSSSSPSPSSSRGTGKKGRFRGSSVFLSSCLGTPSGSRCAHDQHNVCDNGRKGNVHNGSSTKQDEMESDEVKVECYRKVKPEQSDEIPCVSSNVEVDEWTDSRITNVTPGSGSSSARATYTHSLTSLGQFFSRFSFVPGNVSFKLSRATSLGSSRAYPVPSPSLRMLDDVEGFGSRPRSANGAPGGNGTQQINGSSLITITSMQQRDDTPAGMHFYGRGPGSLNNMQENPMISSAHDAARDVGGNGLMFNENSRSSPNFNGLEGTETRLSDRRGGVREPIERNVRFSRTLSVGRLRDRVLRRSSLSDLTFCPFQEEREARNASLGGVRHAAIGSEEISVLESERDALTSASSTIYPPSSISNSSFSMQDHEVEISRSREARYHGLLEHRSNFLERRRRIRSQVRALQRLGSRFENLSGHERSCILSGQHRTGHCTCHVTDRDANSTEDTSARASISRIVMLAEALFEVLDEIHQQSVVLSPQNSVSLLGSVPAPIEVVESLPLESYSKSQKHQHEEAVQCYICLVEYEDGDSMRILPCHHEFHRTCIDKWLKEIHRVCPLCRGDICRSESFCAESRR